MKYGNLFQNDKSSNENTLFGAMTDQIEVSKPPILKAESWSNLDQLNREKELVGIYLSAHPLDTYTIEINSFCNTKIDELNTLGDLEDKDVSIGGIVTAVRTGITKTGNPFGGFTIEDYTGTYEAMFFGKDYLDYKSFCTEGYSLYVRGKVQQRRWGKEEVKPLEFSIKSIQMLGDLREKMLKSISIKIPLDRITEELVIDLNNEVSKYEGNTMLKFLIYDIEKNIDTGKPVYVEMFSRTFRVDVTNDLIDYLENHSVFEYKLE